MNGIAAWEYYAKLVGNVDAISATAHSEDQQSIAIAFFAGNIHVYTNDKLRCVIPNLHRYNIVEQMQLSTEFLISVHLHCTNIKRWNTTTGELINEYIGHTGDVFRVMLSRDHS
jgi:hypothetical protein